MMALEEFDSKHGGKILMELNKERLSAPVFCDVIVTLAGCKFPAHKAILASISDYFKMLFTTEMSEKYQKVIEIRGVSPEVFEMILNFIYTSKIKISYDNVFALFVAADYLTISDVKDFCATFIMKNQSVSNCIQVMQLSTTYCNEKLESENTKFMKENFAAVVCSESLNEVDSHMVAKVLLHKGGSSKDEDAACRAIFKWMNHDLEKRRDAFDSLFDSINLERLSKRILCETVAKEELVTSSRKRDLLVLNSIKKRFLQDNEDKDWQERWREMDTDDWRCESIVGNDRKCSMVLSKFTAGGAVSLDVREVTQVKNPKLFRMFKQTKDHFSTFLAKPTRFLFYGVPSEQKLETICHVGWNTPDPGVSRIDPPQFFTTARQALSDARPDAQGLRRVIFAEVVVGRHCVSIAPLQEMRVICQEAGYDSVANNVEIPTAFTVFEGQRAYPLFVVTFAST